MAQFRRVVKQRPVSGGDGQRIHSGLFWGDGELQIVSLLFSLVLWLGSPFEVKVYTLLNEKSLIFESGGCLSVECGQVSQLNSLHDDSAVTVKHCMVVQL